MWPLSMRGGEELFFFAASLTKDLRRLSPLQTMSRCHHKLNAIFSFEYQLYDVLFSAICIFSLESRLFILYVREVLSIFKQRVYLSICSWSNKMPSSEEITWIAPYLRT